MKLVMVGTGYVGLVSGACFAEFGLDVVCVDLDRHKIDMLNKGEIPIYEPGLKELVDKQVQAGRLSFTTSLDDAMKGAKAVFIAVGTPPRPEDGHADLKYVYQAAQDIAERAGDYTIIVNKSTVPVGTAREVEAIVAKYKQPSVDIDVCSNPEFLREGAAIDDFLNPDRVVVGTDSEKAKEVLREIYKALTDKNVPLMITAPETSEIIKYAANAFLATKITFINQIADLCEASGGNVADVAKGIGLDERIGSRFLQASPGYGGSCFPKDTLALTQTGQKLGAPQTVVESVVEANRQRQKNMAQKIIEASGGSVAGKTIGILGIAFKADTDDVRDAPSLTIIPILQDAGATILAYDPQAQHEADKHLENINWKSDPYDVSLGADTAVLMTAWDDFKDLSMKQIGCNMKSRNFVDLHNIYDPNVMKENGFHYVSIGRQSVTPKEEENLKQVS